ncbi:MAG: ABC transporter substrate-binding protein [Nitratireductor sp.]
MKFRLRSALLPAAFALLAAPVQAQSTFVYADTSEPSTIDPAKANANWEFTITRNVFDRLVGFDLDDPATLLPGLATEWSQDGTTWTFTLREDVQFHDGTPFDSADVKASLDRLMELGRGQSYLVAGISEVSTPDAQTVVIETETPNVFLAGNLARIEIASDEDIANHDEAWFGENANGTGPFKFVSWTRGTQIELARNTEWWGEFPEGAFDRVLVRVVTDGQNRAQGVEGGTYDMANFIPLDDALRIVEREGFHKVEGNNLWAWPAIYLNVNLAPTDNIDFRSALVKAFDYEAIKSFNQGLGTVPRGPVPEWFPGSPEGEMAEITQDMDGARADLEASGQDGATMKCVIPNTVTEFRFSATVLQAAAREIGVTVEIEEAPFVEAITAIKENRSNCFILGNANLSPNDATKFFAAHYLEGGFFNAGKFKDPELEELIAAMPAEADEAKRAEMLKQAAQIVVDSHYIIWAARPTTVIVEPDRIGGYRIDPAEYVNIRLWEIHATE